MKGGRGGEGRERRRAELGDIEEGEEMCRSVWGPNTHVGEKEQDPGEECDDLPGQPQVVHCGVVRVGWLGGGNTQVLTQPLKLLAPDPDVPPTSPTSPTSGSQEPPPSSPHWVPQPLGG